MQSDILKALIAVLALQYIFPALAYAVKPPLEERAFYQEKARLKGGSTYPGPWIDIEALQIPPDNKQATQLRDWLLKHQTEMQTWPPLYANDKDATTLIKAWQKMRRKVEKWQPSLVASPEFASLAVTFWVYGHNLDEPDAADHAYALIDNLIKKFRDHPLPLMMKGMLLSKTGGEGPIAFLDAARTKTSDKSYLGLIDMAIVAQCAMSFKLHSSVVALNDAIDECPACVKRYQDIAVRAARAGSASPDIKADNPYYLYEEKGHHVLGSSFFGFEVKLSPEWSVDRYRPYDPQSPIGIVMLNATPLPDSGLIHGVMFFTALTDGGDEEPVHFLDIFAKPSDGVQRTRIKPLVKSRYLTHWYRLDTPKQVGDKDTITMLSASGVLRPEVWKLSEHRALMRGEGSCELSLAETGELQFQRSAGRVEAPVEFTVNYSASKGSYAEAEKKMKEIISTLEFEMHTFSEIAWKLDRAAK